MDRRILKKFKDIGKVNFNIEGYSIEIVNLICDKCNGITLIKENIEKKKCYWCDSSNIKIGYNIKK